MTNCRRTTSMTLGLVPIPKPGYRLWWIFVALLSLMFSVKTANAEEPKPKGDGPAPKVLDARLAADKLRAPGSDRYGAKVDWANVPPWRQASFYGIRSQGQVFVYVVDCSGSMIEDARLARAKVEVRRSVMALQYPQRFKVIFYNEAPLPSPGDAPKSADLLGKDQLLRWMSAIASFIAARGSVSPSGSMVLIQRRSWSFPNRSADFGASPGLGSGASL